MPQNPTPEALTSQQERALDRLLTGATITAAAQAVNADRSTLHRWLREDPQFQATYNRRRRELQEAPTAGFLPSPIRRSRPLKRLCRTEMCHRLRPFTLI